MSLDIWSFASLITKFMLYLSIIGLAGSIIFKLVIKQASILITRHSLVFLTIFAFIITILSFSLRGAALTGDVSGMYDFEMLNILSQTLVGDVLVYRLVGLGLILTGLFSGRIGQYLMLAGAGLTLWSFSQMGHANDIHLPFISMLFFIHFIGVAFWVGALLPLYNAATGALSLEDTGIVSERFGVLASILVPVLIVAGATMSWRLVGSFENLFQTSYGQVLILKVLTVSALLLFAAANKLRFVPHLLDGQSGAALHLAKSIKFEIILVVVIFFVTAVLTSILSLPKISSHG